MKIGYIGYQVQEKYLQGVTNNEDHELLQYLNQKGLDIDLLIWNDDTVNWNQYDFAILKSPWDYHEHIAQFYNWLDKLEMQNVRILNPTTIVKWNSDKSYLKDIAESGLPIINTVFLEEGEQLNQHHSYFEQLKSERLVIKPCVSAGAKNTIILTRESTPNELDQVNRLLLNERFLIQPFEKEIENGEWSFLFFNGNYSHSVLKIPKTNDFRVQHYHGGTIDYHSKTDLKHIEMAKKYVVRFAKNTLYARVDGILKNNEFHLMELELIEPYLFLNSEKIRFENYYQALIQLLKS